MPPKIVTATPEHEMITKVRRKFGEAFPDNKQNLVVACAPGRVNLIGEHTDYNEGFVFPMAIELRTYVCAALNGGDSVNMYSTNVDPAYNKSSFQLPNIEKLTNENFTWSNYIRGVINCFHDKNKIKGFDIVIISEVPLGGGLSSSASLEVATYTCLEKLFNSKIDNVQKAYNCQKAEHTYADMPCGIMDQMISATGVAKFASLIDCENTKVTLVPFSDPSIKVLITNSNERHTMTGSEYPDRRNACHKAAKVCGKKSLRYTTMDELKSASLSPDTFLQASHVVNEIKITAQAAKFLEKSDYESFGELMYNSHNNLSEKFTVSTAELDSLVKFAKACKGVLGSRMTGGGFGGCTVTLVKADDMDNVVEYIDCEYKKIGKEATFYVTSASDGAKVLE